MVPAMQAQTYRVRFARRGWIVLAVALAAILLWVLPAMFRPAAQRDLVLVSQVGREFRPDRLVVAQGGTIRISNDDADLTHHAYVASGTFDFDSGDQAPGRNVDITFSVPGAFNVLCGIHPKMRLSVVVR